MFVDREGGELKMTRAEEFGIYCSPVLMRSRSILQKIPAAFAMERKADAPVRWSGTEK